MKSKASLDMQTEAELSSDNLKRNRTELCFVIKKHQEMKQYSSNLCMNILVWKKKLLL